jgi:hypothetical protein
MFHIHAIVEECETMGLQYQINPNTKKLINNFFGLLIMGMWWLFTFKLLYMIINGFWPIVQREFHRGENELAEYM